MITPDVKESFIFQTGVVCLLVTPVAMLTIDQPVTEWVSTYSPHTFFQEELWHFLMLFEVFGHWIGVALAFTAIFLLDPKKRKLLFRCIVAIAASELVTLFLKSLVIRFRPRLFFHDHFTGESENIWQSFDGVEFLKAVFGNTASFPSGHSTVAWSLAVILTWCYPQGCRLFFFLAIMVMIQRVLSGAHFPSDTLAGAAIGIIVTSLLLPKAKKNSDTSRKNHR